MYKDTACSHSTSSSPCRKRVRLSRAFSRSGGRCFQRAWRHWCEIPILGCPRPLLPAWSTAFMPGVAPRKCGPTVHSVMHHEETQGNQGLRERCWAPSRRKQGTSLLLLPGRLRGGPHGRQVGRLIPGMELCILSASLYSSMCATNVRAAWTRLWLWNQDL